MADALTSTQSALAALLPILPDLPTTSLLGDLDTENSLSVQSGQTGRAPLLLLDPRSKSNEGITLAKRMAFIASGVALAAALQRTPVIAWDTFFDSSTFGDTLPIALHKSLLSLDYISPAAQVRTYESRKCTLSLSATREDDPCFGALVDHILSDMTSNLNASCRILHVSGDQPFFALLRPISKYGDLALPEWKKFFVSNETTSVSRIDIAAVARALFVPPPQLIRLITAFEYHVSQRPVSANGPTTTPNPIRTRFEQIPDTGGDPSIDAPILSHRRVEGSMSHNRIKGNPVVPRIIDDNEISHEAKVNDLPGRDNARANELAESNFKESNSADAVTEDTIDGQIIASQTKLGSGDQFLDIESGDDIDIISDYFTSAASTERVLMVSVYFDAAVVLGPRPLRHRTYRPRHPSGGAAGLVAEQKARASAAQDAMEKCLAASVREATIFGKCAAEEVEALVGHRSMVLLVSSDDIGARKALTGSLRSHLGARVLAVHTPDDLEPFLYGAYQDTLHNEAEREEAQKSAREYRARAEARRGAQKAMTALSTVHNPEASARDQEDKHAHAHARARENAASPGSSWALRESVTSIRVDKYVRRDPGVNNDHLHNYEDSSSTAAGLLRSAGLDYGAAFGRPRLRPRSKGSRGDSNGLDRRSDWWDAALAIDISGESGGESREDEEEEKEEQEEAREDSNSELGWANGEPAVQAAQWLAEAEAVWREQEKIDAQAKAQAIHDNAANRASLAASSLAAAPPELSAMLLLGQANVCVGTLGSAFSTIAASAWWNLPSSGSEHARKSTSQHPESHHQSSSGNASSSRSDSNVVDNSTISGNKRLSSGVLTVPCYHKIEIDPRKCSIASSPSSELHKHHHGAFNFRRHDILRNLDSEVALLDEVTLRHRTAAQLRRSCSAPGITTESQDEFHHSVEREKHLEKWRLKRMEKQDQRLREATNDTFVQKQERRTLRHSSTDTRRRPQIGSDATSQQERGSQNCCALAPL